MESALFSHAYLTKRLSRQGVATGGAFLPACELKDTAERIQARGGNRNTHPRIQCQHHRRFRRRRFLMGWFSVRCRRHFPGRRSHGSRSGLPSVTTSRYATTALRSSTHTPEPVVKPMWGNALLSAKLNHRQSTGFESSQSFLPFLLLPHVRFRHVNAFRSEGSKSTILPSLEPYTTKCGRDGITSNGDGERLPQTQ